MLSGHTIVTPQDAGIAFAPEETGTTFYENSIIKAKALYQLVGGAPVIADDSGLCVAALGGRPGIYSARYAGPDAPQGIPGKQIPQTAQNAFLIEELNRALTAGSGAVTGDAARFPYGQRSAHYTCAMTLYCGGDRLFVCQETMDGALVDHIDAARGTGGFGYDPIFFLPDLGKTAAELSSEEKNARSHRGKAMRALMHIIAHIV